MPFPLMVYGGLNDATHSAFIFSPVCLLTSSYHSMGTGPEDGLSVCHDLYPKSALPFSWKTLTLADETHRIPSLFPLCPSQEVLSQVLLGLPCKLASTNQHCLGVI